MPWRRKWQPTPVFLPGKSHGQGSLVGCSPWGCRRVGHNLATKQHSYIYIYVCVCVCMYKCIFMISHFSCVYMHIYIYIYIHTHICAFCLTIHLLMDTCCYQSLLLWVILSWMWNSRTGKIVYGIKTQNSGSFCWGEDANGLGRGMVTFWSADGVLSWSPRWWYIIFNVFVCFSKFNSMRLC